MLGSPLGERRPVRAQLASLTAMLLFPAACQVLLAVDEPQGQLRTAAIDASVRACDDVTFCDGKCGASLKDACGVARDCVTPCGDTRKCDGVRCVCESSATWCEGRCREVSDNCARSRPCGECEGGVECDAIVHTCGGCQPEPKVTTCTGKACGLAKNNCGQDIDCGGCPGNGACEQNRCCEPPSVTCARKACGSAVNNCGQTVPCGGCTNGMQCSGTTCACPNGRPLNDDSNCGVCGNACECRAGECAVAVDHPGN